MQTTTRIVRASRALSLSSCLTALITGSLLAAPARGESERYRQPPNEIVRILDAPPTPFVATSPDGARLLLLHRENLPPIAEMAQPMLRLAGRRINPDTNAFHGPRSIVGVTIKHIETGEETPVDIPMDGGVSVQSWSPDSTSFVFTVTGDRGVSLWIADAATGRARQLTRPSVNALGPRATFTPDGEHVLVPMIPRDRGPAPQASPVPTGPNAQENRGGKPAPVRTYQDLLQNAHEEALFEHYFTSRLTLIDVNTGERSAIGPAGIYTTADPSPTGAHILVKRIEPPYSRLVPMWRFGESVEVWDRRGRLAQRLIRTQVSERVPIGGVPTGPRSHQWRDTAGTSEILWVEALDEGDPKNEVEHRDSVMVLKAPFTGEPREVFRTAGRFSGVTWLERSDLALIRDYERDTRWSITTLVNAVDDAVEPRSIWRRNVQDRYADPGSPEMTTNIAGRRVARFHDGALLLTGSGATPEGDRPFLDRLRLASLESERLWRNEGDAYEYVVDALSGDGTRFITRRETASEPPNYFIRDLTAARTVPLTDFPHPAPQLLGVAKDLVTYTRNDGVELSATLYLPPNHTTGDRLPLIVWAYPREFNDARTASQVSGSPHRFTMFGGSSHLFLLLQGYAVMDGAAMPVVGSDPETVNDTFIEQIVASAQAAIDKADEMGVGDPDRVGVGGHSYGAFMTANLLAHSDIFRAGVARSGAYNRTLTPFGFQAERRTLWEAPDVYFAISPFMHADKINEPMLLIHGEIDNNSGTFPIQSERMYHAIKGHGGVTRLVMLPHESHGYRARESVLHVLAEMIDWFDQHVKRASSASSPSSAGAATR